ncbi:BgTH12-06957 [Blumeria graminis f. sp. triticale]|uniref:Bgt-4364 n=4 Tax=Blumeria graminis TaxID=34373 RepID=A0A9X9MPV6_BLUGR|nr:BgTH12-06957 [Blumeria graminis f. sp. triticale]VDB94669.1 Bgt-4364 [Blumeria graminis f. sp. tritici]
MNCPSRVDWIEDDGYNQNPKGLAADLTTREDLNGRVNLRARKMSKDDRTKELGLVLPLIEDGPSCERSENDGRPNDEQLASENADNDAHGNGDDDRNTVGNKGKKIRAPKFLQTIIAKSKEYLRFVGPGFMISVAYIDPGNYSTGVVAGATFRFKLLCAGLMSNIFAIFLQSLCIKLGSVSGLNLAEACRAFLPRWLNYFLYGLAELAIIATDVAEVIGTAIAINLLIPKIPLVVGCALSIIDVLFILLFYNPNGSMKYLRSFECFVSVLVLGVVVCFCLQLSLIKDTSVVEVFRGYLPSREVFQSQGLYQACGILGATVMPHSLYLGSGLVQPRLREYDVKRGIIPASTSSELENKLPYQPSPSAIKACLKMFVIELTISLFIFALFVNSAILITAGASLYGTPVGEADLFGIYNLLSTNLSSAAGTIFALSLLLSGISAGIVGTISGQMVAEGSLNWTLRPWLRRLITRSISIVPSIVIAAAVGREGLNDVLNASQVVLSITLPFITAPLIFFTCRDRYMTVRSPQYCDEVVTRNELVNLDERDAPQSEMKMTNNWVTTAVAVIIWLIIAFMNVANLVLLGKGVGG